MIQSIGRVDRMEITNSMLRFIRSAERLHALTTCKTSLFACVVIPEMSPAARAHLTSYCRRRRLRLAWAES